MAKAKLSISKVPNATEAELQSVAAASPKVAADVAAGGTIPIRVSHETKRELERLIEVIEHEGGKKRIKVDMVIRHALSKLKEQDIEELRSRTVSYSELFDREFHSYRAKDSDVTKDEFLGLVLLGKVKIRCLVGPSKAN